MYSIQLLVIVAILLLNYNDLELMNESIDHIVGNISWHF